MKPNYDKKTSESASNSSSQSVKKRNYGRVSVKDGHSVIALWLTFIGLTLTAAIFVSDRFQKLEHELFLRHETIEAARDQHNQDISLLRNEIVLLKNQVAILESESKIFRDEIAKCRAADNI